MEGNKGPNKFTKIDFKNPDKTGPVADYYNSKLHNIEKIQTNNFVEKSIDQQTNTINQKAERMGQYEASKETENQNELSLLFLDQNENFEVESQVPKNPELLEQFEIHKDTSLNESEELYNTYLQNFTNSKEANSTFYKILINREQISRLKKLPETEDTKNQIQEKIQDTKKCFEFLQEHVIANEEDEKEIINQTYKALREMVTTYNLVDPTLQ